MLQGYADDSGSDGSRAPYVLGGYIMEAEKWAAFSDDWDAELRREPVIKYFKMAEAHNGSGQFFGVPIEFRKYKARNLVEIIHKHDPTGLFSILNWEQFRKILMPHTPAGPVTNPYSLLYYVLFDAIIVYERQKGILPEVVQFDFDEQGEAGEFARMIYPSLKSYFQSTNPEIYKMLGRTPDQLDDELVLPLQAADMLAGTIRRSADPQKPDPDDDWGWLHVEIYKTIWHGAVVTDESLRGLIEIGNMARQAIRKRGV